MINQENIEKMFDVLNESAIIFYEKYKTPYLDGVIKTCENIITNSVDIDNPEIRVELLSKIQKIADINFQKEEIRKAFQYVCLRGFKHSNISNQMITPETIGIFINYLITKLYKINKINILDPITGTSNLLVCVGNNLGKKVNLIGVDSNLLSYKLSIALLDLLDYGDKVYYQDTLTFLSPLVDLILGDFSGIAEENVYNIIRHHANNIIEGGFLVGVLDENVVREAVLIKYLKDFEKIWKLFGLIKLPKGILKNQNKSIVILQKTGKNIIQPKKFLLVELPEFSNQDEMRKVINQLNDWFKNTEFYKLGEK